MTERWAAEQEAMKALVDMMALAERCRLLFERAGLALPEPLKRLLGPSDESPKRIGRLNLQPPDLRSRPSEFQEGWISVDQANLSPMTAVFVVLAASDKPLRLKELVADVHKIIPHVNSGSIVNAASKLRGQGIKRADGGWTISDRTKAPILNDGKLWGPPEAFQKTEIAAHRRAAILCVLDHFESGLQALQILEQLKGQNWVHAPLTKDLMKEDLKVLATDQKVRRRGNSKKWEIAKP